MPVFQITSPNGREVEIEGDQMPSDSELDEIFSSLPEADTRQKIATPTIEGEIQQFRSPFPQIQPFSPMGDVAGAPDTQFTQALYRELPAAAGGVLAKAGEAIYEGGVTGFQRGIEGMTGLPREFGTDITTEQATKTYPKPVQVAIRAGEGMARTLPQLAGSIAIPQAAPLLFGLTPEGFDPKAAVIAAALPYIGTKAGLLTESLALKTGLSSDQALQALNRIGGVTGAAALIGADEAARISQLPESEREQAWVDAAANVGSQFLLGGIGPMQRPKLSQAAAAIAEAPLQPRATVDESAAIRSGLPPRATPEMLPELQRTKELVDQAIQESTQKIVEPGKVSALELLRRQQSEIVPATTAPEFRPGGGEAIGGKTSFNREGVQNAIQPQAEPVLRNLREEAIKGQEEMPAEVGSRPTDEGGGETKPLSDVPTATEIQSATPAQVVEWKRRVKYGPETSKAIADKITDADALAMVAERDALRDQARAELDSMKGVLDADKMAKAQEISLKAQTLNEIIQDRAAVAKQPPTQQPVSAEAASLTEPTSISPVSESVTQAVTTVKRPDLVERLLALKAEPSEGGKLFSLPHPDAIKTIGKQLWNDAIDVAIAAVKAGRATKAAIAEAISHIKRNARNYDENQIKLNLESVLKDEGLVSTSKKPSETAKVPDESAVGIEVPEGQKARSFSARASVSEKVPAAVQEQIKTDPRSAYTPQSVPEVTERVKGLTDAQLFALTPESPEYTVGRAELAQRAFDRGDNQSGLDIYQEAAKSLTTAGQIINQAKLLNAMKPEASVFILNENLKKAGKDPLTPQQQKKALDLARDAKAKQDELNKATEEWKNDPTAENAVKAEKAQDAANAAALEVQKMNLQFQPKTWAQLLKTIMQGNLLTPISEVANVASLVGFVPVRAAMRTGKTGIDILQNYLTGKKRTVTVSPVSGTIEAGRGAIRGLKPALQIAKAGSGSVAGESRANLQPAKAWVKLFSKTFEGPTEGGKITANDRLKLLVEGTLGVPAEVMLRGLGVGDAITKEAFRSRIITNEAALAGVPKSELQMAIKFPELFFDVETQAKIKDQTAREVFQRESRSLARINDIIRNNYISDRLKIAPDVMDLAVATVAPYKQTPWNIIGETFSYAPPIAAIRGLLEGGRVLTLRKEIAAAKSEPVRQKLTKELRGHQEAIGEAATKFLLGSTMVGAATLLYQYGIISPSLDTRDEQVKERLLAGEVMPPNHINISALKRVMKKFSSGETPTKEDYDFRPGDDTRNVMRAGGLVGASFYTTANILRQREKQPEEGGMDAVADLFTQSMSETARFGLNQSFLSGVEGLLGAVRDGQSDQYVKQWLNTVSSIPFPNSMSTLSRATRDYKPDMPDATFKQKVEGIFRNRFGWAGYDDYLPLKRGLFGEPLRETPKDRNALFYHLFDVTKGQQVTDDPKRLELFRLWRKTDDSKVIPTPVKDELTIYGKDYQLTKEQQSNLAELVGTKRAEILDRIVVNPNWHKLSDEQKIKVLGSVYDKGLDYGKAVFWQSNRGNLKEKPPKAGFKP